MMIGDYRFDFCTVARPRLNGKSTAQQRSTLFHTHQPKGGTTCAFLLNLVPVKTDPVIKDTDADVFLLKVQMNIYMGCLCMLDDIVQTFLNNAEDGDLHGIIQVTFFAMDIHSDMQRRMFLNFGGIPAQRSR